jgi:hypothetical protein
MHTKDMYLYVLVVLVSIAEDFADCSSFGISVVLVSNNGMGAGMYKNP